MELIDRYANSNSTFFDNDESNKCHGWLGYKCMKVYSIIKKSSLIEIT